MEAEGLRGEGLAAGGRGGPRRPPQAGPRPALGRQHRPPVRPRAAGPAPSGSRPPASPRDRAGPRRRGWALLLVFALPSKIRFQNDCRRRPRPRVLVPAARGPAYPCGGAASGPPGGPAAGPARPQGLRQRRAGVGTGSAPPAAAAALDRRHPLGARRPPRLSHAVTITNRHAGWRFLGTSAAPGRVPPGGNRGGSRVGNPSGSWQRSVGPRPSAGDGVPSAVVSKWRIRGRNQVTGPTAWEIHGRATGVLLQRGERETSLQTSHHLRLSPPALCALRVSGDTHPSAVLPGFPRLQLPLANIH